MGNKISTSSTKFVFFGSIGKTRWPPWPLIGWDIFDFSSETPERNSTKLYRKQDLNVLYQVCVFRAGRKNKMAALASDWLRHFQLLLWNRWTEFNETWQEARSQSPLPSLCFSVRPEKQDGHPGLWLAETFSTFPLKPLNRIQQNLTGSKISESSTKFVFFGLISKQMSTLADSSKRWHIVLRCTICGPLGILFKICLLQNLHIIHHITLQILYVQSFIMIKTPFSIHPKMRIWNFTKMGEGLQCCRSSPGEDLHWKGKICNAANLPPWGKVCNVADLPGEGLQCCRSSGGGGGGGGGGRSAIQHRLQFFTGFMDGMIVR